MTTVAALSAELRAVGADNSTVLHLEPVQGMWTPEQYLALSEHSSNLIEFTDGVVEVLPMPTRRHQAISRFLFLALLNIVQSLGGALFYAPLRLQIRPDKFREPDLLLLLNEDDLRNQDRFWLGADLVVEIVSPDDPARDTVVKRADYAEAAIPECWIVNPVEETITVLVLDGEAYTEHGTFRRGETATSRLLGGFLVDINGVMDAR